MKINLFKTSVFALMAVFMASCANINITKRTHRPGYHIDVVKNNDRKVERNDQKIAKDATERPTKNLEEMHTKSASVDAGHGSENSIMASAASATPIVSGNSSTLEKSSERAYKRSDFRWTAKKKKSYKKPMFSSDDHWSAWVAFFAGAASLMFAMIALIVAFFGVALWPVAIVFGVAAIVFAIIHKKNGWSGEKMRKLGLLFGIIGAGVGLIATIIWAIWWAVIL